MFPAHAGMNRPDSFSRFDIRGVPRACGDEPGISSKFTRDKNVFPAHAGMNRETVT